jgi:hypothetical protein
MDRRPGAAGPDAATRQIALWSLLAAGVGSLLSQIAERVLFGGRLATRVLGGAWALLTCVGIAVLVVSGLAMLLLIGGASAVRNVYAVALYRYAVDGEPKGGFAEPDLQHPFKKKR